MTTTAATLPVADRSRLVRYAKLLAWSSLVWMTAEGVIAVVAGVAAGSIALIGFGIDSAIEGMASVVIIWRFWGSRALSETAERRAQKLVAVQFFILAPYVAIEAVRALMSGHEAETSWLGIGLTVASAAFMPAFGIAKRRVGAKLGSAATAAEGTRTCFAPTCLSRCSQGCSATPSLAGGGSTPSRRCLSHTSRYRRAGRLGEGRNAAATSPRSPFRQPS